MKANELMIGDWVDFYHPYEPEKKIVTRHRVTEIFECGLVGISNHPNPVHADHIEPVKITPEILEKNGFKPYIPENHLETVYACQDVSKAVADELYALWPYQDGSFYLLLRVDGKDMVRMDVHYIHQLQHALRLCGIDKNIEL